MSSLYQRIDLMVQLGQFLQEESEELSYTIALAHRENGWFTENYVKLSLNNICAHFLQKTKIEEWLNNYPLVMINAETTQAKTVGIVMAGNLPLVGFHDFLSVYLAGFQMKIKLSSKDQALWKLIFKKLQEWDASFATTITLSEMLKNCDAYIATGNNNSAQFFEQYFSKYPNIIRKNRTSVAVLTGKETDEELLALENSISTYFGLGCRNISKIFVPEGYEFEKLIAAFSHYNWHRDHNKFKNNYDFQLAMFLLNKVAYMATDSMLLVENEQPFAPISVLNYSYYSNLSDLNTDLNKDEELQCIETSAQNLTTLKSQTNVPVIPFGKSQSPSLSDYADNVDTMQFLSSLY